MSTRIMNILRTFLVGMLCVMLLCGLWQVAARVLFHQELPSLFGYSQLTVASGSMEPALSVGDVIVIHQEAAYHVGDVIAFWDDGILTTHRAVALGSEGFTTKGDFNNAQDGQPVAAEQIAGRMVLVLPLVGNLLLFLRTPLGLLMLVVGGVLLLFLPDFKKRTRGQGKRCAE